MSEEVNKIYIKAIMYDKMMDISIDPLIYKDACVFIDYFCISLKKEYKKLYDKEKRDA